MISNDLHVFLTTGCLAIPDVMSITDSPERRLVREVLRDAILTLLKQHDRAKKPISYRETMEWLTNSDGNGWIFSFTNVCTMLELDPSFVRRVVLKALETPPRKIKDNRKAE